MATATYKQSRCKWARREGQPLPLVGPDRPIDSKCRLEIPPGQHGAKMGRARLSDYGLQLRQKQMIRRIYGILEKQFRNHYKIAAKRKGSTAENLIQVLESRLDNIVYRLQFAATRAEARQMVNHKHIFVNGELVNIPSYQCKEGDVIEVRQRAKNHLRIKAALDNTPEDLLVEWMDLDRAQMRGVFKRVPTIEDMPSWYNLNLIVELYSK